MSLIGNRRRQPDLKKTKKGDRKNHKDHEEQKIQPDIRRDIVEYFRTYRVIGKMKRYCDKNINKKNKKSVKNCVRFATLFVV